MLEIERKYEAADDLVVPDLASVRGVASVTDPVEHVLTASYFDTADRVLAMWGVTVRRRVGGSDEGWHLKLPSAVAEGERHEIRLALGRAKHTVPKPFRSTLRGLVGDRELVPVATLSTRRTVRELHDGGGRVLAEVVDDHVEARAARSEDPVTWRELEVELVDGDQDLLDATGRLLEESGATTSVRRSKLEHAAPSPSASCRARSGQSPWPPPGPATGWGS